MINTFMVGKVLLRFEELPSTNTWLLEMLSQTQANMAPPEGLAVRADTQTAGRGQFGSVWMSEPGANLTLSVLLYPLFLGADRLFVLNMAAALALRDTALRWMPKAPLCLKWPNDLYLGEQKIAGLLLQNALSASGKVQHSVLGVGLNVNQTQFPADLPHASSMASWAGDSFDLDAVQDTLFEAIERRYFQLKAGDDAALRAEYLDALLGFGTLRLYTDLRSGRPFMARIIGVDQLGRLLLSDEAGESAAFEPKTLAMVLSPKKA